MFNFQALIDWDNSILDGAELVPAGIDPEILKSEIMLQCGLLQPLYPEPETMKAAIKQWFSARQWTFQHLLNIITAEYSPIENTDRHDEWTRTIERALDRTDNSTDGINEQIARSETVTYGKTETATENLTHGEQIATAGENERNTSSEVDTTGETIGQVAAFNSDVWQNSDKNNSSGNTTGSETVTETNESSTTHSGTDSKTNTGSTGGNDRTSGTDTKTGTNTHRNVADEDEDTSESYTQHLHGNIGVTTNQEMIEQELSLLAHFNIYTWIAMNLRDSLFLEVY